MSKLSNKQKLDKEREDLVATGLISDRFSGIAGIQFRMTYYRRFNQVLMERTLSFSPADYAGFHLKCMHEGCTGGGYDLAPVVASLVRSRKKSTKGKIVCRGKSDTALHGSISYEVSVQYQK